MPKVMNRFQTANCNFSHKLPEPDTANLLRQEVKVSHKASIALGFCKEALK
jgi:hypothetical protein